VRHALTAVHAAPTNCDVDTGKLALDGEEQAAFDGVNAYRVSQGAPALKYSPLLTRIALWKSSDMAARGYVAHDDTPIGRSSTQRYVDCGYVTGAVAVSWGENIAGCNPVAAKTVQQWEQTPENKENMLNSTFRYAGIKRVQGIAPIGAGGTCWYWAMNYGSIPDNAVWADTGSTDAPAGR
jgi:uncharacterized protein YkwD